LVNAPGAGKIEEQSSLPASGRGRRVGLIVLWGLAVLIFGVGDILTTAANIGLGGTEGNAIVLAMMELTGGSIWVLTLVKGTILSGLFLLSYLGLGRHAWIVPAVLTCAGTYLLLYNVASLALFF
jgi:hypothetical protein